MTVLSGPMFEPRARAGMVSILGKEGAHYNIFAIDSAGGWRATTDPELGMATLKSMFPRGDEVNEENFVLFSTSGIHGNYATIEEIAAALRKYGDDGPPGEADDWFNQLTVLIVQPRIVCLRYGVVRVREADISWLLLLRASSWNAAGQIGSGA